VLAGMIQNHPHRASANLGRKFVRRLACHGSILSGVVGWMPLPSSLRRGRLAIAECGR
jgi:hypothetical protein